MKLMSTLKEVRIKIGMTQAEVGNKAGLGGSYISHIENGRRFPQGGTLQKILAVLKEGGAKSSDIKEVKQAFRERWEQVALGDKTNKKEGQDEKRKKQTD